MSLRCPVLCVMPLCLALFAMTSAARAQTCEPQARYHARAVSGEACGDHNAFFDAGPDMSLALLRDSWGWRIAVLDATAQNLVPASRLRGVPSPLELHGWHFRNADNSGPNTGEINAPQHERRFAFAAPGEGEMLSGLGRLTVRDYGLGDLEPGQRARMVYLRFDACLMWPKTEAEIRAEADFASLEFLPEEREIMRGCGLDPAYALEARFPPRMLGGDFDGDDALDHAAFVRRVSDGRRGVAVCRAGTWIDVLGVDGPVPGSPMEDGYFDRVETWAVSTMEDVADGWTGEGPRPQTAGDVLVLERVEKALYSVYWDGTGFRSHQHYRYVEP